MLALSAVRIAAARHAAESSLETVVEFTARIASVAAPTFAEHHRARLIANLFRDSGYTTVAIDDLGDVIGTFGPTSSGSDPSLLLAAHLDTVFPIETRLEIGRQAERLCGPGVGDNSVSLAALVVLPRLLRASGVELKSEVTVTGNVGEEGLGNLRGMRAVMDALPSIGAVVAIEGHGFGRVSHSAVGSRRLRVTVTGPGGHSWGNAGRASAIHELAKLIGELTRIPLAADPKTSLNVGLIEGGVSVNTIAPRAAAVIDMRSVDSGSLAKLSQLVEETVQQVDNDDVTTSVEVLGDRPSGSQAMDSRIIAVARDVLAALGIEAIFDASSTDANIPISRGVPAICIRLTHGGNDHREDEYIETAPLADGLTQLVLVVDQLSRDLAQGALSTVSTERA